MGLFDALAGGIQGAAQGMADITDKQIEADILEQRQSRLLEMQEAMRQAGREKDFAFDTDPGNVKKRAEAEGLIEAGKTKAIGDAETAVMSSPARIKAEKDLALARHIVDPSVSLTAGGDGRIMRVDSRSGKALGYLQDPATGKDFQGQKDVPASAIAAATSNFTQGAAMYKDATTDQEKAAANKLFEEGRALLAGKQPGGGKSGWDSATGEVMVNGQIIGKAKTIEEAVAMATAPTKKEPTLNPAGFTPAKGGRIETPETRKDPITGDPLTKSQWEKKFGKGEW